MFKCEKMYFNIHAVIWHLLQFIFDIVDLCYWFGTFAKAKCKNIQRAFGGEDITREKHLIEQNKVKLTKVPVHLAVILGTELPDFGALSKIIIWCLSAGIQNISFYDHQGKCHDSKRFIFCFYLHLKRYSLRLFWFDLQEFWCQTTTKSMSICRDGERITIKFAGIRTIAMCVAAKWCTKMGWKRSYRWISCRHASAKWKLPMCVERWQRMQAFHPNKSISTAYTSDAQR